MPAPIITILGLRSVEAMMTTSMMSLGSSPGPARFTFFHECFTTLVKVFTVQKVI
jgi:hypothetical protein